MTVAITPLAPIANKESLIERFGDWFAGLFHKSETIYEELEEDAKKAAVWGSGIVAVVNVSLDKIPAEVIVLLQQKFPDLSLDVVHGFLDTLRMKIDTTSSEIPLTLEEAITWLQGFLSKHKDDKSVWGYISSIAGNILSTLLSPATPIEKFLSIAVYVYHAIVKPHVEAA